MINMERKVLMTIKEEDSTKVGTTIAMTLVSVHFTCKAAYGLLVVFGVACLFLT